MIERHIDYLQFSALFSEQIIIQKGYENVPAPRFYKRGYRDNLGNRFYFGNPNSNKALVVCSGEALQNMRSSEKQDFEILVWAFEAGGIVSRIDLAVTEWIENDFVSMNDCEAWVKQGLVNSVLLNGGAKTISAISEASGNEIQTLYVGDMKRRGKSGIFRAYDKGVDLGIGTEIVTRLELEMRGEVAQNAAMRLAETGDIAGNFRSRFDVKSADFQRLMDADAVATYRGKAGLKREDEEKMEGRWQWLMNQVAPALKDAHEWDRKNKPESKRFYWFLREAGMTHEQIKRMVDEIRQEWENRE